MKDPCSSKGKAAIQLQQMNDIQKYRVSTQISNSFQEKLEITDKKTNKLSFLNIHPKSVFRNIIAQTTTKYLLVWYGLETK